MTLYKLSFGNTDDLSQMFRVLQCKKGVNILYKIKVQRYFTSMVQMSFDWPRGELGTKVKILVNVHYVKSYLNNRHQTQKAKKKTLKNKTCKTAQNVQRLTKPTKEECKP